MIFGKHDEKTLEQFADVSSRAAYSALMADGHAGYVMPIGGVTAYRDKVSVVGVGVDISCGNMAAKTDIKLDEIYGNMNVLADAIYGELAFGMGRVNESGDKYLYDFPIFSAPEWELIPDRHERDKLLSKAKKQLGTIGGGNHYVDVFVDEENYIWVGAHFGSRGFGYGVAYGFLALSQNMKWSEKAKEIEVLMDTNSPLGQDYMALMDLASSYAYLGREYVVRKVVELIGGRITDYVHNNHNLAFRENHFGEDLIVIRKGATPAFPGQRGFVGGSMGDDSVILEGVDSEVSRASMYSTVHGAGRVMSRTKAAGKYKGWGKKRRLVAPGIVSKEMMEDWVVKEKGVILRGGGLDESPHAYRRLGDVLKSQGGTIKITHTLRPIIVCMAPADEHDPYKE